MSKLVWCEVDTSKLGANLARFRELVGRGPILAPTVKANAYGHGIEVAARAFLDAGADWLTLNSLDEARALRSLRVKVPLYLMGYVPLEELAEAVALDCRLVVYNPETINSLGAALRSLPPGSRARVHLKLETGNYRQGVDLEGALGLAELIHRTAGVELEGAASHFADIEDTTDHTYARVQLERFHDILQALEAAGHHVRIRHCSNSAATILWPHTNLDMVRIGISAYGMWPSAQTRVSAVLEGRHGVIDLQPALCWKTRIAQIKDVPQGAFIGYGRSFRTTHPTRLGVLPAGYYDGYDRGLSNMAHVLVRGRRAPVRGRVCMNMIMVDLTDIPEARLEDEVVLLGAQGEETLSAEQLAEWIGTINYEVTTRIAAHVSRVSVPACDG